LVPEGGVAEHTARVPSAGRRQPPAGQRPFSGAHAPRVLDALMLAALAAAPASLARASEPNAAAAPAPGAAPLTWSAPTGCGSAAAVQARVSELLDEPELAFDGVQVEARVSETAGGWALHLLTRDALGTRERELQAAACADLVEAAAIAITLAFEAARSGGETPPVEVAPTSPPAGERAAAEPAAPPPAAASPTASAGAELLIDLNSLAAVAAGPSLFVALGWDALSLGLHATWLPGTNETVGPAQAVEVSLLSAGLSLCYALGRGLLDTAVCAGLDAGQLTARGAGLRESRVVHDPWLSTQAGLMLSRELGAGLALQARGELVVPLLRQTYGVNETEAVYRVASLAARFALGARIAF